MNTFIIKIYFKTSPSNQCTIMHPKEILKQKYDNDIYAKGCSVVNENLRKKMHLLNHLATNLGSKKIK